MTAIYLKKQPSHLIKFLIISIIILPLNLWSQSFQSYCFPKSVNLNQAEKFAKDVLTSTDKIIKNKVLNCLEIQVDESRVELVEKYLSSRYQVHTNFKKNPSSCDMEIIEISKIEKQRDTIDIGRKSNISRTNDFGDNKTVSVIKTLEGKWSTIQMNDTSVDIKCEKRGSSFEIEVRIDSEKGFLSTSSQVRVGEILDLGAIVKEINERDKSISLDKGLSKSKTIGTERKTYQLIVR